MTVPMLDPEAALSSPAYASFGARLRALVVDSIVVSLGVVAIVFLGMVTSEVPGSGRVMVAGILALVLLYEPLMVWRFGGTIGHRRGNLLVVADETGGNPSLGRAMIRYAVKTALGALSFVTMALTRRHQAAHDRLSATTVQIRDITKAKPWDVRLERAPMSEIGIPSRSRRVGIIVVYLIVLFLAYAELFGLVVSSQCTMRHLCSAGERLVSTGLWLGWLGACAWCIIAGWRGRLIGARRGDIRPVDGAATLMAVVAVQALLVSALPLGAQSPATAPTGQPPAAPLKAPPSADSLGAISYRGYLLAQYDYAAAAASDSVLGRHPDEELIQGYVAHRRGERWDVAFGRLSAGRDTFYTAFEARQRDADPGNFDVVAFTPARVDTGYYARARRAIAIAKDDFGKQPRPYNTAVIERPNGSLWVYLMPAQVQAGVYPLGADVRYLFPADGRAILAKRKLHNTVIEYGSQTNGSGKIEAGTHTAVLDDIPEDTDVFLVLTRRPRVPEYIVTDEFMYYVATNGDIRLVGRRPDEFRKTKAP